MIGTVHRRGSASLAASAAVLFILALPQPARGQGFGLDLSEETSAEAPAEAPEEAAPEHKANLGLDLGSAKGTDDFRPSFAFLGLKVVREDGAAPSFGEKQRFERLANAMIAGATLTGFFSELLEPSEVGTRLAERAAEATTCEAKACLDDLADALGVERVANALVTIGARGPRMTIRSYARADAEAKETVVLAATSGFEKQVGSVWREVLQGLSAHLGKLVVRPNFQSAQVALGDRTLGNGKIEELVPAGTHLLKVTDANAHALQTEVRVSSDGVTEVDALLRAKGGEEMPDLSLATLVPAKPAPKTRGPALWKRPGVYLAAAGLAAVATGIGFGASAKSLESQGVDSNGDGVRDITRVEMQSAHTKALLANVLLGAGCAAVAGGAIWLVVEPVAAPAGEPLSPGSEPGDAPRISGLSLSVGGTFQ